MSDRREVAGPARARMSDRWEVALPARAELGERPVWDAAAGGLVWVDINAGRLHRFFPVAGRDEVVIDLGRDNPVGAAAPRRGGGYVLAAADGFRLAGPGGQHEAGPLRPPGMGADLRFNDGACDPAGRLWAGTVAGDRRPGAGALYRLDGDGTITQMRAEVTESNGIGWSPDASLMYFIDSGEAQPRVRVFGYEPAGGAIDAGRDLITFGPGDGIPDGLVVDAQGCLWIAMWSGAQVRRYSAAGELLDTVALPVSCPTCPGFGGDELRELYVTSAWEGMDAAARAAQPLAGHIFRIAADASGQPATGYAG
ncbi:MAG TPA: SMP-30/gluconolactonase/LRE family protein [Streptosporangiaceae bacterium]|nr:SMP-30/gluconolactonase/LRE family protein [Streptosporangiaceae bacterium]